MIQYEYIILTASLFLESISEHILSKAIYMHSPCFKVYSCSQSWGGSVQKEAFFLKHINSLKNNCSSGDINVYFNIYLCRVVHLYFLSVSSLLTSGWLQDDSFQRCNE